MATTDAYRATGIIFQRKCDTADVSKARQTFLRLVLTGEGREAKKKKQVTVSWRFSQKPR